MTIRKNDRLLWALSGVFLALEGLIAVQLFAGHPKDYARLQFSSIVLAFFFCFVFFDSSKSYIFTQLGLFFTLISDYFLILDNAEKKTLAMLFFSCAQIFYFLRIYFEDGCCNRKKLHFILRIYLSLCAMLLTVAVLGAKCDALATISIFYFTNLLLNVVFSYLNFKKSPILAVGLSLFLLCDITVGISALSMYFPTDESSLIFKLINPGFDLTWAFYLPSQALIAISLLPKPQKSLR